VRVGAGVLGRTGDVSGVVYNWFARRALGLVDECYWYVDACMLLGEGIWAGGCAPAIFPLRDTMCNLSFLHTTSPELTRGFRRGSNVNDE
jgi:hypothetical protein